MTTIIRIRKQYYSNIILDILLFQNIPINDEEDQKRRYIGSVWLEPRSLLISADVAFTTLWHGFKTGHFDVMTDKVFNRPKNIPVGTKVQRKGDRYSLILAGHIALD